MIANREICAEHLAGMVRFPTVSRPDTTDMDAAAFVGFQNYLKTTYPTVHAKMNCEKIGFAGLLFHYACTTPAKRLPILLCAHQDVVPEGDATQWKYPPFSGTIAEGFVWGRGSSDCKGLIMAHMEALEALFAEGFEPQYDIYLAYGYNEEIGSASKRNSADWMCEVLRDRGIRMGVVIDEGGFVQRGSFVGIDKLTAYIYTAEKGCASYKVYKEGPGGHTAFPTTDNLVADIARAIVSIEDNALPARLEPESASTFRAVSPYMDRGQDFLEAMGEPSRLSELCRPYPLLNASLQTVIAMTTMSGSPNQQSLPTRAEVCLRARLLNGDTTESVLRHLKRCVAPDITVELDGGKEASPYSSTDSDEYRVMERTIEEIYGDVLVLPCLLPAGTDAYYYYPICDCVYRFNAFHDKMMDGNGCHGINERLEIDTIDSSARFFYQYLRNLNQD